MVIAESCGLFTWRVGAPALDAAHLTLTRSVTIFLYKHKQIKKPLFCSVVKHVGSGRAREKCRGKDETQSIVLKGVEWSIDASRKTFETKAHGQGSHKRPLHMSGLPKLSFEQLLSTTYKQNGWQKKLLAASFIFLIALCVAMFSRFISPRLAGIARHESFTTW